MKWFVITVNVLAAVGFFCAGEIAAAIHRVHSLSTYAEFVSVGAVYEARLKSLKEQGSTNEGYDMLGKMQQIGNAESWFKRISRLAALACILNAVAIWVLTRRRRSASKEILPSAAG